MTATPSVNLPPSIGTDRLLSLDTFRGATIVAMILVNNPGSWSHVYGPLLHAKWQGWTPTDLVFPFFLFIVGVAIPLALGKELDRGASRGQLTKKATKRSVILFGLGLLLAIFPLFHFPLISGEPGVGIRPAAWDWLRIMGVLQRIALCYLACACAFLFLRTQSQRLLAGALLVGYWLAMTAVPVPGFGPGELTDPVGNLGAFIDRALLGENHLWAGAGRRWDPEGLFSTIPAIATTLFGVFAGQLIRKESDRTLVTLGLLLRGCGLVGVGFVWNYVFSINKSIWTSSYAVFTAGLACIALGLCYWFLDARPQATARRFSRPFVVYGVNALTVFVLSGLVAKSLILIKVPFRFTTEAAAAVERTSLHSWIYAHIFEPLASPVNASLMFALTWIGLWYLVLAWMYRRNWILKV